MEIKISNPHTRENKNQMQIMIWMELVKLKKLLFSLQNNYEFLMICKLNNAYNMAIYSLK